MAAFFGIGLAAATSRRQGGKTASSTGDAAPLIATSILEKIPPRASAGVDRPGDFVNFLVVGTETDLTRAFNAAGWTPVKLTGTDATQSAKPPADLSIEEYLAMPLSEEFLSGKPQDYGFVQSAPVTVIQARHAVRIWKAPFAMNGQVLWVGAASHEGPWWDSDRGTVNSAADPNLDDERDFLGTSLQTTGLVKRSEYVASEKIPPAASDGFRTDGRIFVMTLIHL